MTERLDPADWRSRARAHEERADALTAGHRARRAAGLKHPVEDFLFTYYSVRPAVLRRWHPGAGVSLASDGGPIPLATSRWYRTTPTADVHLDLAAFLADRGAGVSFTHRLLAATASRPPAYGCFGLHEWAMVYRQEQHRHSLPLRLGQAGTDQVVESLQIRCTHYDAFRFFTPAAVPLNTLQPTRESQAELDQPGCLHAGMDLHKWAGKLGPAVPGELALDCFELSLAIRRLDMQASPYDVSSLGEPCVPIETAAGRTEYVTQQREFAARGAVLRQRLLEVCERLVSAQPEGQATHSGGTSG